MTLKNKKSLTTSKAKHCQVLLFFRLCYCFLSTVWLHLATLYSLKSFMALSLTNFVSKSCVKSFVPDQGSKLRCLLSRENLNSKFSA